MANGVAVGVVGDAADGAGALHLSDRQARAFADPHVGLRDRQHRRRSVRVDTAQREVTGSVTSGNFCGYLARTGGRATTRSISLRVRPAVHARRHLARRQTERGRHEAHGGTTYGDRGLSARRQGYRARGSSSIRQRRPSPCGSAFPMSAWPMRARTSRRKRRRSRRFESVHAAARAAWNERLRQIARHRRHEGRAHGVLHRALSRVARHQCLQRRQRQVPGVRRRCTRSTAPQRAQYANFSGWDVYRSQLQLVTLARPGLGSDIAQSLFNQADQNGGVWDRWTHLTGATSVMNGDPSAPAHRRHLRLWRPRLRREARLCLAAAAPPRCRRRTISATRAARCCASASGPASTSG